MDNYGIFISLAFFLLANLPPKVWDFQKKSTILRGWKLCPLPPGQWQWHPNSRSPLLLEALQPGKLMLHLSSWSHRIIPMIPSFHDQVFGIVQGVQAAKPKKRNLVQHTTHAIQLFNQLLSVLTLLQFKEDLNIIKFTTHQLLQGKLDDDQQKPGEALIFWASCPAIILTPSNLTPSYLKSTKIIWFPCDPEARVRGDLDHL